MLTRRNVVTGRPASSSSGDSSEGIGQGIGVGLGRKKPRWIDHDSEDIEGMEGFSAMACKHGLAACRRIALDGVDSGRRFLGCTFEGQTQCSFVYWIDPEWPPALQRALEELWSKAEAYDHYKDCWSNWKEEKEKLEDDKLKIQLEMVDEKMRLDLEMADHVEEMETMTNRRLDEMRAQIEELKRGCMMAVTVAVTLFGVLVLALGMK